MRHRKHNHQLGVKTAHRTSMLANLCCSLIENGRIKTTLARARALRPTIEKIITLAKKAHLAQDPAQKIHYRRLAISRLRSKSATKKLFDEFFGLKILLFAILTWFSRVSGRTDMRISFLVNICARCNYREFGTSEKSLIR